ncbi:hypothetical protein MSIMFI_00691 [Mycobacterium simulans]|nr:hypothetical protein MSIMFI_00691 [Mycobacterium simulans]
MACRTIFCAALTRCQATRSRFQQCANTCHPAFEGVHVGLPSNQPSGAYYCAIRRNKSHRPRRVDLCSGGRMPATRFAALVRGRAQMCSVDDAVWKPTSRRGVLAAHPGWRVAAESAYEMAAELDFGADPLLLAVVTTVRRRAIGRCRCASATTPICPYLHVPGRRGDAYAGLASASNRFSGSSTTADSAPSTWVPSGSAPDRDRRRFRATLGPRSSLIAPRRRDVAAQVADTVWKFLTCVNF